LAVIRKNQKIDAWGNLAFGAGLTLFLIAMSYALLPYGDAEMGWGNPYVIAGLIAASFLLVSFPFIERRVKDPMFKLQLFKNRMFSAGNFATLLASISRGGVTLMLVILLQGIWLPLHGYAFEDTPFWAGIYMIPMTLGFALMGPISGWLSDRYGARGFSTFGMLLSAAVFLSLTLLPYQFSYITFALAIFGLGLGLGMFASPNTASIMNSVPPEDRGVASGMRSTLQNTGSTVGMSILFTIVLVALAGSLGHSIATAAANAGAPQLSSTLDTMPPTTALFAAFLGYNPMGVTLTHLPPSATSSLSTQSISILTSKTWFPTSIAPAFMSALGVAFYFNAGLAILAAAASALRGKRFIYKTQPLPGPQSIKIPVSTPPEETRARKHHN
ncbi:MAG TPA: MFS transporter, partial [Candidatus Acidoferrales bacterium]|nr:MFS transporter [Candidatus Acidoferrales bacterium]